MTAQTAQTEASPPTQSRTRILLTTILSIGALAIVVALFVMPPAYTSEALDARLTHEYGSELAKAGITSILHEDGLARPHTELVYRSNGKDVNVNWTTYYYRAVEMTVDDGQVTLQGWREDNETDSDTRDSLYSLAEWVIADGLRAVSQHKQRANEWATWELSGK